MTICIAAFAADKKAIVCVADKAVTYGTFKSESTETKIVEVEKDVLALTAGAEKSISRMLGKFRSNNDFGKSLSQTISDCQIASKECMFELLENDFLNRHMLTLQQYVDIISRPEINDHIRAVMDDMQNYQHDNACQLIVCGFTANSEPFLLKVCCPGVTTDITATGYCAVGSGFDWAMSMLLWSDVEATHGIDRILYETFNAKANAEGDLYVGTDWDAKIKTLNKSEVVPKDIKKLVEQAWVQYTLSPYEERDEDSLEPPPDDWKRTLEDYAKKVLA
jgi:20S proteasome alpha/beta subunit